MPLHKILSENSVRQVKKLLEGGDEYDDIYAELNKANSNPPNQDTPSNSDNKNSTEQTLSFLARMAQKVLDWAQKAGLQRFSYDKINKLRNFITIIPKENDDPKKKLGKMVTGWIAIISAIVGAAFLAKWLIKLFLKAVQGGVNALKKFFGIFSAKTKIPLETPNE
jgi:hypothetical protein